MTEQQLVMPSPELVEQLRSEAPHGIRDMGATRERYLIHAAYRAGVNAALSPKPPSLADQALRALNEIAARCGTIRAALERLKELEGQ